MANSTSTVEPLGLTPKCQKAWSRSQLTTDGTQRLETGQSAVVIATRSSNMHTCVTDIDVRCKAVHLLYGHVVWTAPCQGQCSSLGVKLQRVWTSLPPRWLHLWTQHLHYEIDAAGRCCTVSELGFKRGYTSIYGHLVALQNFFANSQHVENILTEVDSAPTVIWVVPLLT